MESLAAGPSGVKVVTRREIFNIMQHIEDSDINKKLEYAENYVLSPEEHSEETNKEIKHKFSYIKSQMKRRWVKAHYKEAVFIKQNHDWLQGTFEISPRATRSGRPSKEFQELSVRSKRRETEDLCNSVDSEKLMFAGQLKLQTTGKRDASKLLQEITSSPKRATKYKKAYYSSLQGKASQLSPLQALAMYTEASLSRRQYEIIRSSNKKMYPCYTLLQKAKTDCYPNKEAYQVTATCVELNLQQLLNHTTDRLLLYLKEVRKNFIGEENKLTLICKWGCDGSHQAQFKQKFESTSDSDAYIFQSSFVPLQLVCGTNNKIIWQNPTPSSPHYCRPIRIRFIKESVDVTNQEIDLIQHQINSLNETQVTIESRNVFVKYNMMLTMIDGKVCNAVTQTASTLKCYICGATSKEFNNLLKMEEKEINKDTIKFGLSILHARIRIFENLLHLSYKLTVKKWQVREEEEKNIVKRRKLIIQEEFKNKMGLIVDVPKPGLGNTNDGNTSRRFFMDPNCTAEITGLDLNLIYRFKVILEAISSGYKIHFLKFAEYTMDTAKLYVRLYPWNPMSPTMHKILIHGPTVIKDALLPIGQLSEEAAEARNKHFRLYRHNYARKHSRESCNLDVINRLLLTSDPLLTGMRPEAPKKTKPFLKETVELLLPLESDEEDEYNEDQEEMSSEEESLNSFSE